MSGSSCLFLSTTELLWSEAQLECELLGARLVVINTESKQNEVVAYLDTMVTTPGIVSLASQAVIST